MATRRNMKKAINVHMSGRKVSKKYPHNSIATHNLKGNWEDESMPDIRKMRASIAEKDLSWDGIDGYEDIEMADMGTLEEKVNKGSRRKHEDSILYLAGCAVRQRATAFEELETQIDKLHKTARSMDDLAFSLQKQVNFIKKLVIN